MCTQQKAEETMDNHVHRIMKRCFLNINTYTDSETSKADVRGDNSLLRIMQWNVLADG